MSQIGRNSGNERLIRKNFVTDPKCYCSVSLLPGLRQGLHCQISQSIRMKIPLNCYRYPNLSKSYSLHY